MPQVGATLFQRFTISLVQIVFLAAAVFLGFLFAGLGTNPFATAAHIGLIPHFCFVAVALLLSACSRPIQTAVKLASYGIVLTLPVNWILNFVFADRELSLSVSLLGTLLIFASLGLGWILGLFQSKTARAETWISTTVLSCTILLFTLMPNPT